MRTRVAPAPAKQAPKPGPSFGAVTRNLVLLLLLPAVIFGGVLAFAQYEKTTTTAPPPGHPGALVWSNGSVIFANKNELAAWLRQHGGSFQGFKRNHPAAVILVSRPKVATTQQKIAAGTKTPAAKATTAKTLTKSTDAEAVAPTPGSNGDSHENHTSIYALVGAALLLLLLACAPVALFVRLPGLRKLQVPELRLLFGGVGVAIAAGLVVSLLLS